MAATRIAPPARRRPTWLGSVAAAVVLAACATSTPYQPVNPQHASSGGYSDQQVEANRFRVTFSGNSMTSRETVEHYLLYRAAELTTQRGFDWFVMADRNTDKKTSTRVDQPFGGGPWGYWGPSWSFYGPRFGGWRTWDPYFGGPFGGDGFDVTTIERYEATAEIVTGHGPKPADNPRAFDARQVMANLGPAIVRPT